MTVTFDAACNVCVPPSKPCVPAGHVVNVPLLFPPCSRLNVPLSTSTSPLLLKTMLTLVAPVVPVFVNTPLLLNVETAPQSQDRL